MRSAVLFCLLLFLATCREDERSLSKAETSASLAGRWLYVERGYSPGGGYITEAVSGVPPQTIQFFADMTMDANVSGLSNFRYYRLSENAANGAPVLTLFRENPGDGNAPSDVFNTYFVTWEGGKLKLHLQGCIEGCHMGFERISDEKEE